MNFLSLQSEVVYGHVGQGAARFALQRLGHEVWALPTVLLSSHAGYAHVAGEAVSTRHLRDLLEGLSANGWLSQCDAVLSGYLGSRDQAEIVEDAVIRVRQANARAIFCLDPVFGDSGRAYSKPGVAEAMARTLLPLADIVTPNAFELAQLARMPVRGCAEAYAAALHLGRPLVVATSIPAEHKRIGALAATRDEAWFASTPRVDEVPHGAGDLFAALFVAATLSCRSLADSLRQTTASVFHILAASRACDELRLIAEQHALANPPRSAEPHMERIA